ncbi:MAG: hypothetical protein COB38_05705 [Gammaproteobacteria bacterium]|nr:MAG: hypothetical protein COB38_05705 [Gammaproteobacteria bacterium]
MLTSLVKLFKALNSEQNTGQLAMALSLSAILGLTPLYSLHNILILLIVFSFRVNLSLFFLSYPLFAFIGYLLSDVFESVGLNVLQTPQLIDMWQSFFNTIIGRWSNFYYSGVIGSLLVALVIAIIIYPLSKRLINLYRNKLLLKIEKYHLVKMLKASAFWKLYEQS